MNKGDKRRFVEMMNETTEYYGKPALSDMILKMYFTALERFSYDQIYFAICRHLEKEDWSQVPKISHIVKFIEGEEVTTDQIIAAARNKDTPMGILCRIQIGTHDLGQEDMFYLKQRATECQLLMHEWKERASKGDYSDHEISIMVKHKVDPSGSFMPGLAGPIDKMALRERVEYIVQTPKHKYLLEKTYEETDDEKLEYKHSPEVSALLTKIAEES